MSHHPELEEAKRLIQTMRLNRSVLWSQYPELDRGVVQIFLDSGLSSSEFARQVGINSFTWYAHWTRAIRREEQFNTSETRLQELLQKARTLVSSLATPKGQFRWMSHPRQVFELVRLFRASRLKQCEFEAQVVLPPVLHFFNKGCCTSGWEWPELTDLLQGRELKEVPPPEPRMPPRTREIFAYLAQGYNQSETAEHFGVSRQRISQIIKQWRKQGAP